MSKKSFRFQISDCRKREAATPLRTFLRSTLYVLRTKHGVPQSLRFRTALCAYFQRLSLLNGIKTTKVDRVYDSYMVRSSSAGFSLVETLVAITILLIAVLAPMRIVSQSIITANFAREELTAIFLAQEGIEYVIRERDNDALNNDDNTWDWYDHSSLAACRNNGCSYDVSRDTFDSCSVSGCTIYFEDSPSNAYYYSHDASGTETSFKRKVTISKQTSADHEVIITAEVTWYSALVRSDITRTMATRVFNHHE